MFGVTDNNNVDLDASIDTVVDRLEVRACNCIVADCQLFSGSAGYGSFVEDLPRRLCSFGSPLFLLLVAD